MRVCLIVAALAVLCGCATPADPASVKAEKTYYDCVWSETERAAKTSVTAEAAADSAIAACSKARSALLYAVRVANHDDAETSRAMSDYDDRMRAAAIDYANDLRKGT